MKAVNSIILFFFFIFSIVSKSFGQSKPPLDFAAIDAWSYVEHPIISSDGRFAAYALENSPKGYRTLVIRSTENDWEKKIVLEKVDFGDFQFSTDNRYCLFTTKGDSLGMSILGTSKISYIAHVNSIEVMKGNIPGIIYERSDSAKKVVVYNTRTNKKILTVKCESYLLSPKNDCLVYLSLTTDKDSIKRCQLIWYDLIKDKRTIIWQGKNAKDFKFDPTGNKLAFIAEYNQSIKKSEIMYYEKGDTLANVIAGTNDLKGEDYFASLKGFSKDGTMLFFNLQNETAPKVASSKKAKVDVWSFNDPMIQSAQLQRTVENSNKTFAVLHITDRKIYFLWNGDNSNLDVYNDPYLGNSLLRIVDAGGGHDSWNKLSLDTVSLISCLNGETKLIAFDLPYSTANTYKLSPDGRYIIYFDSKLNNYFSYSIKDGTRINLTKGINAEWDYAFLNVQKNRSKILRGVTGWITNTEDVLIQERYDIWRVSLDGKKKPICITRGYGKRKNIQFYISKSFEKSNLLFNEGEKIYLSAFNTINKRNGFFCVDIKGFENPLQLTMGDYAYFIPEMKTTHSWGWIEPVKAKNANAWLVGRQSYNESINYFFTTDFKNFKPISDNHPERDYNWVKAELIKWKLPDGHLSLGILYKPENFNPSLKYPVIFNYYEELSNNLNLYLKPERSVCDINIPYYVSNGYLVFTPDIERTSKGAGEDALNTMESASKYLAKLPFIDANRMGLCGTSMGGYKTNYIITHSKLFAAANPISGTANISAFALSLWGDGSAIGEVEVAQFYLGHSIVERPDLYVKNSPIFYVNNIQTPLLMMYNKEDVYNYVDGVALFQALRRVGKPAWMLQYDGQGHFLDDRDTIVTTDWTIRQKQFFDHYLLHKAAPMWMTHGVPASMKGIDDGLEPDMTTKTIQAKLFTPKAQSNEKALQNEKPVTLTFK